ncbi:MAG: 50S ribosomal protein L32 [Candidatus Doudnabacteria bacterium]|nr:50S ribosomal protein L32 [Candidatus Doudnabacteria bacterium]
MAVPKKHKTRSGRNQRRAHDFLIKTNLAVCSNCKYPVMPHEVCQNCGYYKGRQVLRIKAKTKASK